MQEGFNPPTFAKGFVVVTWEVLGKHEAWSLQWGAMDPEVCSDLRQKTGWPHVESVPLPGMTISKRSINHNNKHQQLQRLLLRMSPKTARIWLAQPTCIFSAKNKKIKRPGGRNREGKIWLRHGLLPRHKAESPEQSSALELQPPVNSSIRQDCSILRSR